VAAAPGLHAPPLLPPPFPVHANMSQPHPHPLPSVPASAGAPRLASASNGSWNWFPDAVHANCSAGDCSLPTAWSASNQTAAGLGGGASAAGLLTVAIKDYYPREPTLYFVPGAWCDNVGATVPLTTIAAILPATTPPITRHRRLLTGPAPETVDVVDACDLVSVTATLPGATPQTLSPFSDSTGVYKLGLGTTLPDVREPLA
jgi:hypothetical protein